MPSKQKKISGKRVPGTSVWGNLRTPSGKRNFAIWLERQSNVSSYLERKRFLWLMQQRQNIRYSILRKLKSVDVKKYKELIIAIRRFSLRNKKSEALIPPSLREQKSTLVAVAEDIEGVRGIESIRYIAVGGLKNMLAIMLAANYTMDEVTAVTQMSSEQVLQLVNPEDIEAVKQKMSSTIIKLADQKVVRDLVRGTASTATEVADRIATRRRKLALDVRQQQVSEEKDAIELESKREKEVEERFKVKK